MAKKDIWFGADGEFLGATGCESLEDLAALVLADEAGDFLEYLFGYDEVRHDVDGVVAQLRFVGAHAMAVPTSYLTRESWDGAHIFPLAIDGKPGRGYVKVLGVSI